MIKNKKFIASVIIIGVVLFLVLIAPLIVVDECASPCRNNPGYGQEGSGCIDVCERVTLMDVFLGKG